MAQAQFEPELRQTLRAAFIDRRRATLAALLRRLAPGASQADVGAVVDMAFGAMWYRLLVGHDTPGPALARRLAKLASAAARIRGRKVIVEAPGGMRRGAADGQEVSAAGWADS